MTDASGKRALWILSLLSLVIGVLWALYQYDTMWDFRSWNLVGFVFIMVVGVGALAIGLRTAARSRSDG